MSTFCLIVIINFSVEGRTNYELREKFIMPEHASQGMQAFKSSYSRNKSFSKGGDSSSKTSTPSKISREGSNSGIPRITRERSRGRLSVPTAAMARGKSDLEREAKHIPTYGKKTYSGVRGSGYGTTITSTTTKKRTSLAPDSNTPMVRTPSQPKITRERSGDVYSRLYGTPKTTTTKVTTQRSTTTKSTTSTTSTTRSSISGGATPRRSTTTSSATTRSTTAPRSSTTTPRSSTTTRSTTKTTASTSATPRTTSDVKKRTTPTTTTKTTTTKTTTPRGAAATARTTSTSTKSSSSSDESTTPKTSTTKTVTTKTATGGVFGRLTSSTTTTKKPSTPKSGTTKSTTATKSTIPKPDSKKSAKK